MIFSGQWRASVCWFRHCCRNHFYLFTASASHDEAAFSPQWGLSIRVLPKTPKSGGNVARKKEKSGVFQPPDGRGARSVPGNYCQKSFCLWTLSIWFPPNMDFKYTRTWHIFPPKVDSSRWHDWYMQIFFLNDTRKNFPMKNKRATLLKKRKSGTLWIKKCWGKKTLWKYTRWKNTLWTNFLAELDNS